VGGSGRKADDREEGNKRGGKTSLRIGTGGRKGRGAELSQRRGSLKKRNRSADRAARAEAAIERKTVYLPEYVYSIKTATEGAWIDCVECSLTPACLVCVCFVQGLAYGQ
jgi:hypothetical protein